MPDLEQRIKDGLDRLGDSPDPARVLERVGRRKRHFRLMRRVQTVALVVAVLTVAAGGVYALSRAFGLGTSEPVPGSSVDGPTPSSGPRVTPAPTISLCSEPTVEITIASQDGAAGTIATLWQVTNTAPGTCRSFGYPGLDFHTSTGWLNVQVHRGGFPNINQPPRSIVVPPGQSLYFASYWNDVVTDGGPCQEFDRVKVTLPDDEVGVEVVASGCLNPLSVDVGAVTRTPPS